MNTEFEIVNKENTPAGAIRAAVFDFDGTISSLRCGWEKIMGPMMLEFLSPHREPSDALRLETERYIDESTGIQTIYQMQWLADKAQELTGIRRDPWYYKEEYVRRLAESIAFKKSSLAGGEAQPSEYLIAGSAAFLEELAGRGIELFLASGTDHADVLYEAELLGVKDYFTQICGAPEHRADCSKEAVLNMLFDEKKFGGSELLVVGDGKVEIALGQQRGAFTLGAATDEEKRKGINPVKRARLMKAGAHAITGDFTCMDEIRLWLGIKGQAKRTAGV
jgi:phosphoglycolate phosphatase-like HAD superfamily hydrolase